MKTPLYAQIPGRIFHIPAHVPELTFRISNHPNLRKFCFYATLLSVFSALSEVICYLPPPAQAQAQPAQAHAQPPPPELPLPPDEVGTGFVLPVTLLVKAPRPPITLAENPCTPFTIEAAKSDPGSVGSELPPPEVDGPAEACPGLRPAGLGS